MSDLSSSRRGQGSCRRCGTSYHNRWKPALCQNCGFEIGGKVSAKPKTTPIPQAVRITENLYSVRKLRTGPDHRCFVEIRGEHKICMFKQCLDKRNLFVCQGDGESFSCEHTELCNSEVPFGEKFFLTRDKIGAIPLDTNTKKDLFDLSESLEGNTSTKRPSVVKVSDRTFAVASSSTFEFVHMNNIGSKSFLCFETECKPKSGSVGKTTGKRKSTCIHSHCLVATLGDSQLPEAAVTETTPSIVTRSKARHASIRCLRSRVLFPSDLKALLKKCQELEAVPTPGGVDLPAEFGYTGSSCHLCGSPLSSAKPHQGTDGTARLMTHRHPFWPVRASVRRCLQERCGAIHQCQPMESGIPLFNLGNKLFVTLEFFVDWRHLLKRGTPLSTAIAAKLETLMLRTPSAHKPSVNELAYIERQLSNGYWGFEVLSERDEVQSICGFCGTCPEILIGDGNEKNCCSSRQIEYAQTNQQSPSTSASQSTTSSEGPFTTDTVIDSSDSSNTALGSIRDPLTEAVESQLLERVVFARNASHLSVASEEVLPFMNGKVGSCLINTEFKKSTAAIKHIPGDPNRMMDLIKSDQFIVSQLDKYSDAELNSLCRSCSLPSSGQSSVVKQNHLQKLYDSILHGYCPCHDYTNTPGQTGGYYHMVCRHGVIYGSKILTRRESVRDAVDLFLSMKYPPIMFVCDSPCSFSRHLELRDKELAVTFWGDQRGCFEKPVSTKPPAQDVNFPEILPGEFATEPIHLVPEALLEPNQHPVSGMKRRFIVGDRFHTANNPHKSPLCTYHNIDNCLQGVAYKTSYAESQNNVRNVKRLRSSCAQSFETHFMYNRLMDIYHNEDIVRKQMNIQSAKNAQDLRRGAYMRLVSGPAP